MVTDRQMTRGGLRLAVRDYDGSGSPIVLVHGGGRTLLDWDRMAARLTRHHRVVALDLRCHGHSGDAAWDWDEVCDDVLFVADELGFDRPAIVGHSLGGMIAAKCGRRAGAISAAVNIDGHGTGRPEQYLELSPETVAQGRAKMRAMSEALITASAMTPEQAEAARQQAFTVARELGLSEDFARRSWQRSIQTTADGFVTHPGSACLGQLLTAIDDLDLFEDYRKSTVPLLIFNATKELPTEAPEWTVELMKAFRAGLRRDLAELEQQNDQVSVVEMETTHALILTDAAQVARRVLDFLARCH